VARYLSEAWFDEVNEAARSSVELKATTAGVRLTLQQIVTEAPGGEVRYWLRIEDGSVEARMGQAGDAMAGVDADATLTQSYDTAVAVSRGELRTEDAFLGGHIRLRGDIGALLRHQQVLNNLGEAFTEVRGRTEYR